MNKPVSQRRRHLMIASVAGAVTPAAVFAGAGAGQEMLTVAGRLVVSGRVVDAESKAVAGALVEVARGMNTTTDGDGRFVLALPDRRRHAPSVRVSHAGHESRVVPLTHFDRDDAGTLRTTLGLNLG